jgi:hypothetical protein
MAWMTAAGVYHGSLKIDTEAEDHIDNAQLLPYPALTGLGAGDLPLSLALTEFHFLMLYKDRVVGICNLNDHVAYEEQLPVVRSDLLIGAPLNPPFVVYRKRVRPYSEWHQIPSVEPIGSSPISLFLK